MPRPVIGVPTQTLEAIPGELPACWVMGQGYIHVLRSLDVIPWLIPLLPDDLATLREIYDRLDGLFLTGGVDVDPSKYGEEKQPYCGRTDPARDDVEIQMLRWSLEDKKPVLAVCRGIQVLNVALGGSLYQDVKSQIPTAAKHDYFPTKENPARDYLAHEINVERHTRLAELLGDRSVPVNSMHHQAIKKLADGLAPTAFSPDGLIEGAEGRNGRYLVAVQWHPEELAAHDAGMKRLFTSFVEAAV